MPSFNMTIDDSSPMVQYSGTWVDTPKTDNSQQQYEDTTYHTTNEDGATATLRFNGSAVYIFGARKPGDAGYSVTLDGVNTLQVDAPTTSVAVFNTLLFNATSLDTAKEHEIVLKNVQSPSGTSLDIDYLLITAGDGNAQTPASNVFWENDNTNITYSDGWAPAALRLGYYGGNAQLTWTQGASATVTFSGNAIAVYGTTNADHGMFSISIDGSTPANYNGSAPEARFRTLLYYANGLPPGQHILKLTDVEGQGKNGLDLDRVAISSWTETSAKPHVSETQTQFTSGASGPDATSSVIPPVQHVPTGIIVGSVVTVVVGVILFAAGLFLHCRYRRRRQVKERHGILAQDGLRPDPFMTHLGGSLTMSQGNAGAFVNKRSVSISSVASSTTPSHTFAQPTAAYRASGASSAARSQPAVSESTFVERTDAATFGSGMSEKQRLIVLHAAPPSTISTHSSPAPTDFAAGAELNPHRDLPPPGYGQVFPSAQAS